MMACSTDSYTVDPHKLGPDENLETNQINLSNVVFLLVQKVLDTADIIPPYVFYPVTLASSLRAICALFSGFAPLLRALV